jgi:hypothetical protein
MILRITLLLVFIVAVLPCTVAAQRRIEGGVVQEKTGEPLRNVQVTARGGTAGALTDSTGIYGFTIPEPAEGFISIVAQVIGFISEERISWGPRPRVVPAPDDPTRLVAGVDTINFYMRPMYLE